MIDGVVIIGASVAGVGLADELRALGYSKSITLLDAQDQLPYDRPPLSKGALTGESSMEDITFHPADHYVDADIDLRLGTRAVRLDARQRTVVLETGEEIRAEAVVVATGARARRWPQTRTACHVVREFQDALDLRDALDTARRVAVVGGGFIGAEVASSATTLGLEVVVVEAAPRPFENRVGAEVAELLLDLHNNAGVKVIAGVAVEEIDGGVLRLADGHSRIDADVVVVGLGAVPVDEWLDDSGLTVAGGVVCDDRGRTGHPGVYAAGDVAAWPDPHTGKVRRHEHWTSAREQARIVASDIAGAEDGPKWSDAVDYVWSDQYGGRIQLLGSPHLSDDVRILDHDPSTGRFLALYGARGRLVGAVGCQAAVKVLRQRKGISQAISLDEAVAAAQPK
ncbi:hypothetical protein EEB14_54450 [Rhodococcus sp. WS4]|nr:MAG: hypothetical protein EOP32_00265 [Rhodococcus sp. (in: high G+C Gram-positive bacteria)]TQC41497.1 hypothetical protein EEB14_54450 [Rhodococcus sp. WS4]